MSLLDLFGKDADFFTGQTPEQRARGAGQIAYESIPGISEAVTFRDIKAELGKENPNWLTVGLLGGAGALGLIPLVGDVAGSAIRQGVRARNAVKPSSGVLDEFAKDNFGNKLGINVRSDLKEGLSYSDLILDGKKAYETRDSDSLRKYVGKRVGIVKTGEGDASALGSVIIGEPEIVGVDQFRKLEKEHLVPEGSDFDIKEKKYLYPLINPQRFDAPMQVGKGIVSRKMLNASQKQSQEIIDLLKSGKSDQVTDQMLAKADQRYLFENYDLPMDADSLKARAKEMGLDTNSFHGTSKAFDSQDYPAYTADDIKIPMGNYGNAFFSTDNPNIANTYGNIIYPIKTRSKDPKFNVDAKGQNWQEIPLNDELIDEFGSAVGYEPTSTNMIVDLVNANRPDLDQVKFSNVIDRGSSYPKNLKGNKTINEPSNVTASLMDRDPLVRSRFARFDPRLKDLKNLSAGLIPIGLLPFLMGDSEGAQ